MRLGVLPRAIIVASAFWMVGGTFLIATNKAEEADAVATAHYEDCVQRSIEDYDCWAARQMIYEARTDKLAGGLWGFAASMAAIYLVLALIAFAAVYGSIRWTLAGRKPAGS